MILPRASTHLNPALSDEAREKARRAPANQRQPSSCMALAIVIGVRAIFGGGWIDLPEKYGAAPEK